MKPTCCVCGAQGRSSGNKKLARIKDSSVVTLRIAFPSVALEAGSRVCLECRKTRPLISDRVASNSRFSGAMITPAVSSLVAFSPALSGAGFSPISASSLAEGAMDLDSDDEYEGATFQFVSSQNLCNDEKREQSSTNKTIWKLLFPRSITSTP